MSEIQKEYTKDLVSLIIPCYNMAYCISRQLDSILSQTYPKIELILVNDGSTDNLDEVIADYYYKFREKGYVLKYHKQNNMGQAASVNKALSWVSGEYLLWPDADDYYSSNEAITKMVSVLKNEVDTVQIVRTQNTVYDFDRKKELFIRGADANEITNGRQLFDDCLFGKNGFYFGAGSYIIRTQKFFEVSKYPFAAEAAGGQNWQLLLPMFYHYDCRTILEPLYTIVTHSDSHSRTNHGYEGNILRYEHYESTLVKTFSNIIGISDFDFKYYTTEVKRMYANLKFDLAYGERKKYDVARYYEELNNLGCLTGNIRIRYMISKFGLHSIVHIFTRLLRK